MSSHPKCAGAGSYLLGIVDSGSGIVLSMVVNMGHVGIVEVKPIQYDLWNLGIMNPCSIAMR
jgi:hypothetical protein